MIESEFLKLYEELSILTEAVGFDYTTNKYTKEALDAYDKDQDAEGVIIFTSSENKVYKIVQLYHDHNELNRLNYYIDKFIPRHDTVWSIHDRSTAKKISSELKEEEPKVKIEYIEIPELVDKDLLKKTFKQQLMAGDYIKVLENTTAYKTLMKHYNTNIFKIKSVYLTTDFDDTITLDLPANNDYTMNETEVEKIAKEEVKNLIAKQQDKENKQIDNTDKTEKETTDNNISTEVAAEPKNAKLNRARQSNKKIIKAFQDAGLSIDDLIAKATNRNGKEYKKASDKLNKLRKSLFGESIEDDVDDLDILDE